MMWLPLFTALLASGLLPDSSPPWRDACASTNATVLLHCCNDTHLVGCAPRSKGECTLKPGAGAAYKPLCESEKTKADCVKVNQTCAWTPIPPSPAPTASCVDSPTHAGCTIPCSSAKDKFDCLNAVGYECCVWKSNTPPPTPHPGPPKRSVNVTWSWAPQDTGIYPFGTCDNRTATPRSGHASITPGTNAPGWPTGIDHPELVGHQVVRCQDNDVNLHMLYCNVSYDGYVSVHWRYTGPQGESNIGYPFDGPPVKKGCSQIGGDSHGARLDTGECCFA